MSIASAIQLKQQQVASAYTACDEKGATMPAAGSQNLTNLASTISTISTSSPVNQTIQKWVATENDGVMVYSREEDVVGANYRIPDSKYQNDTSLVAVLIPTDMTFDRRSAAFAGTTNLKYINLENVTFLGNMTFNGSGLAMPLYMPNLNSIQPGGIFQNTKITKILSLGTIRDLGNYMFAGCTELESAIIPDAVTSISRGAFEGCTKLSTINLGSNITSVVLNAFQNCKKLDITLPTSITTLGGNAFGGCESLSCDINLPNLTEIANGAFRGTAINRIVSLGTITTIVGANNNGAFQDCKSLASVTLPQTLKSLGYSTFQGCTSLTAIDLSGITSVGGNAFSWSGITGTLVFPDVQEFIGYTVRGCPNLTSIIVTGPITTIPSYTFEQTPNVKTIDLPSTVTDLASRSLSRNTSLEEFIIRATTPPSLNSGAFMQGSGTFKIYVPYSSDHSVLNNYKSATTWSSYASRIYELDVNGNIP